MKSSTSFIILFFIFIFTTLLISSISSTDANTLLSLKSEIDTQNNLKWQGTDPCKWQGIKQCLNGRVTKLILENFNLTNDLNSTILNQLDQLRVLSFKQNFLTGQIPDLSNLQNLKSIYLNNNNFTGEFPTSLSLLHRLKVIVLSNNKISGQIPISLLNLPRLYILYLDNNKFTNNIPPLNQTSLRFFNVSNNRLTGQIPLTPALIRFSNSSFSGNTDLCGEQIDSQCDLTSPSPNPSYTQLKENNKKNRLSQRQIVAVVSGSVGGFALILVCLMILCIVCKRGGKAGSRTVTAAVKEEEGAGSSGAGAAAKLSWEDAAGEDAGGMGKLVFINGDGEETMNYSLEDLLKASAETLGRGTVGSTYKAVMESGYIVTVKRLRDARYPRVEEFRRQMDILGRLRHPNLVPIRAYFQAKEERLLVYDYFPNGSLFSLIHGSRGSGGGKPLHWTSCLKIAEDVAAGLLYIHQNPGLTHGNLKSSNVLLGPDFESCLTDYGLVSSLMRNPESTHDESSASSLFYRAPECRVITKPPATQQADVYSFGVLVLELLTGKTPFQDLVQEHGSDIPRWVRSVREDETESDDGPPSEDKLNALLNIAMACVAVVPENRPVVRDVLRMVREARAEAHVSSNSSDHSPGRWSDTVQSLPREEHAGI